MKTKRMYQEPKMNVVNIDPIAMICQSPGFNPGGKLPDDPEEGVKVLESTLDDIW